MKLENSVKCLVVLLGNVGFAPCYAIDVLPSAATGGPTAQDLAERIVDTTTGVALKANSANTDINGGGSSSPHAMASYTHGNTDNQGNSIVGQLLPAINRDASNPNAAYTGGIGVGMENGICLCTGAASDYDDDLGIDPASGRGVGVEGPNNGAAITPIFAHPGEISYQMSLGRDADFEATVFPGSSSNGGDATVLSFEVEMDLPGFLRLSYVHSTDEFPAWETQNFNDSTIVLVDGKNIATFRKTVQSVVVEGPLKLSELRECGAPVFNTNQISPAPNGLDGSAHTVPGGTQFYNHEFAGFSKTLTCETPVPLAKGTHTVKIVIQDVQDTIVDSAVFIGEASLKLFPLADGDYNGNGIVDGADYTVWQFHYGQSPATFYDGDGDGDGTVDDDDYTVWAANFGEIGNRDWSADFNRDGCVTIADYSILAMYYGIQHCASRFEGDTNKDGAVSIYDYSEFGLQYNPSCGGSSLMAGGGNGEDDLEVLAAQLTNDEGELAQLQKELKRAKEEVDRATTVFLAPVAKSQLPKSADANGDGHVDKADFALIRAVLGLSD